MNCQFCGATMDAAEKFCPNCGNAVESTPVSMSASTEMPTPEETPESFGMPESMPTPPVVLEKKKKSPLKIVLAIVIPIVVIIIAAVVAVAVYFNSLISRTEKQTDAYWEMRVNRDSQGYADAVPEAYWDYILDTYGYTKEECVDGIAYMMQEEGDTLGENLTYTWEKTGGFSFGIGDSAELSEVKEQLGEFGLDCNMGFCLETNASISGDTDTQTYDDLSMWQVKIDGTWYNAVIMADIDTICADGYVEVAQCEILYMDTIRTYWNAFYGNDVETLATTVPDALWNFIEDTYGMDKSAALDCMEQYISDILTYSSLSESVITFDAAYTELEEATEDEVENYNSYLSEDLVADAYSYVYYDYTMTADGEEMSDSSSSVMMYLGDTWYLYDGIYYFVEACYYYGA